jgi:hypothetical protein
MNQAVYIGAGLDLIPVLVCKDIKKFIYIDSQPFSEFGTHVYTKQNNKRIIATLETREKYDKNNLFGRFNFRFRLDKLMKQNNFLLVSETKYCLLFKNDLNQVIKYHISCAFPEFLTDEIVDDIAQCNTLILCGYHPRKIILALIKEPKIIIGNCRTVYQDCDDEESNIIEYLYNNPYIVEKYLLLKEINEYEYWEDKNIIPSIRDNYKIIECKNLEDMEKIKNK